MVNPPRRDVIYLPSGIPCTARDNGIGECTSDPSICGDALACNKLSPPRGAKTPSWVAHRIVFDYEGPFFIQ